MSEHPLDRTVLLLERDVFAGLDRDVCLDELLAMRVLLQADRVTVASRAGQAAVIASFLALAQLGVKLTIDVPDVPLLGQQPPLPAGRLAVGLRELAAELVQPCAAPHAQPHELTIAIGGATAAPGAYRVTGGDWGASVEIGGSPRAWSGQSPVGGALAGVLVGAAALPVVIRRLERRLARPAPGTMRALRCSAAVELPALPAGPIDAGAVDVISAGAITNAMLFTLLRWPALRAQLRVFDDDLVAVTNLNRYALMRRSDIEQPKVRALERFATREIAIAGVCARFGVGGGERLLAGTVLVGADDIPSRWRVQQMAPGWVHVAGTSHLEVVCSAHPADAPCAGCTHPVAREPVDQDVPTISFVSQLAGLLQAHALIAHAAGVTVPSWYCWPANLAGAAGMVRFTPPPDVRCPVGCRSSQDLRAGPGSRAAALPQRAQG